MNIFKKLGNYVERKKNEAQAELNALSEDYLNKYLNGTPEEKDKGRVNLLYVGGSYPRFKADYVGGHPTNPEGKQNCHITVIPQGLIVEAVDSLITKEEIKGVEIKSEEEVSKDVTLTRMVAFGIYALALKKEKRTVKNYLILKCVKNGFEYSMAFAGDDVNSLYKELFKVIAG